MREKKPVLIITFSTTTDAMGMEQFCGRNGLPGRLIPVPREISADCGLAWKAPVEAQEQLLSAMTDAVMHWQETRVLELWV